MRIVRYLEFSCFYLNVVNDKHIEFEHEATQLLRYILDRLAKAEKLQKHTYSGFIVWIELLRKELGNFACI